MHGATFWRGDAARLEFAGLPKLLREARVAGQDCGSAGSLWQWAGRGAMELRGRFFKEETWVGERKAEKRWLGFGFADLGAAVLHPYDGKCMAT